MKKIKMKDIILEHYQKVHELEMDGLTVRVWKPRTMQQLPAHEMLRYIKYRTADAAEWIGMEDKNYWGTGNPDYGMWDALTVIHCDPRHKTLDIYFAAILVRPFSREAIEWYERHHAEVDRMDRLMLMWDSREFDRINGFDTSYGCPPNMKEWEYSLYHVVNKKFDITDESPDVYRDDHEQPGLTIRFRHDDGMIQNGTSWTKDMGKIPEGFQQKLRDCLQTFLDFNKQHPEFIEMHFYTERTDWESEADEVDEQEPSSDETN